MTDARNSHHFYADLPEFSEFAAPAAPDAYFALPDDWTVFVADVVQSTAAIERGDYKSVNMVGAASIICVLNVAGDIELPFVFGGDGGLIAVPPVLRKAAELELQRLQSTSRDIFDLALRAAGFSVSLLRKSGADIFVRKYQLGGNNRLAMFYGDGPTAADHWLKSDAHDGRYHLQPDADLGPANLDGLSCRWEPLEAKNGQMLTIIAQPSAASSDPISNDGSELTAELSTLLQGRIKAFAPAKDESLRFRWPPRGLRREIAAGAGKSTRMRRSLYAHFTALMQLLCERFQIKISDYDGKSYRQELIANTDFRKFDGALKMVLDVTPAQADAIENYFEEEHRAGRLLFGTWRSKTALMTCLLFDLKGGLHVHFIDGSDGGYALAAKALKARAAGTDPSKK